MAQIIGKSQAWQQVTNILNPKGISAEGKGDLNKLLKELKLEYAEAKTKATLETENTIQKLTKEVEAENLNYEEKTKNFERLSSLDIEFFSIAIQLLQKNVSVVRKRINSSKAKELKTIIKAINIERLKYPETLKQSLARKDRELNFISTNKDKLIEDKCKRVKGDIGELEQLLKSPELAGAVAELELIEYLKKLPDDCYIINGITLILDKAIRFDGKWLKSAQIDHLVITPAGVFVIETKNWSKEFTEHGNYFDPYQQVKRASYLCYKILGSPNSSLKVKNIIAYRGNIPQKQNNSFVKVLHFQKVNDYILWHKEKKFSIAEINQLISYLRVFSKDEF